jgi:hypothetical protein
MISRNRQRDQIWTKDIMKFRIEKYMKLLVKSKLEMKIINRKKNFLYLYR